ncbi:metal ABC transporter ATP-binding protein [soil metagenome]
MPFVPGLTGSEWTARARGLELRFGDIVALAASDFGIPRSGVTSLIGPNGSGKSTLLAAVAGLHRPTSGEITVLGTTPIQARSRVAFVPQRTNVNDALPVTVREVVAMGRYASLGMVRRAGTRDHEAVAEAIALLDLTELSGRHVRELSGGQRQRVFVAQGLVQDRDVLLLDEPTTALDMVSARVIDEAIRVERASGRPVVVTTHDLEDARKSDHVILLAGRVVAEGLADHVLTPEHLSEAYRFNVSEEAGQVHLDDAAHSPVPGRHLHVEPPRYEHPGSHDH